MKIYLIKYNVLGHPSLPIETSWNETEPGKAIEFSRVWNI